MISWKHSFKRLSEENEMAKRKRQALDNLFGAGKISQSTYDAFSNEIDEAIAEIEGQQKALFEKMNSKINELEGQVKTLEMLLANFEIQHVTGDIDEETYQQEIGVLSVGLETAKHELDVVREALNQLSGDTQMLTPDVVVEQKIEPQPTENVEAPEPKVEVPEEAVSVAEEKLPEPPPVEPVEVKEEDSFRDQQETSAETTQTEEEPQPTEAVAESEEKQET